MLVSDAVPPKVRREKLSFIKDERDLHKLVKTVLEKMGFDWVEIAHGAQEFGKDLVAATNSSLGGREYVGVVAKLGKISGGAGGKRNLGEVRRQVDQAFTIPYDSSNTRQKVNITRALVVCTGSVSANAKREIVNTKEFRAVEVWSIDELERRVTEHFPEFYLGMSDEMRTYLVAVTVRLSDVSEDYRRYGDRQRRGLEDVFVEPTIVPMSSMKGRRFHRGKLGRTRMVLDDPDEGRTTFDTDYLQHPDGSIIVMGAPGSGKTMALRKAALRLARRRMSGDSSAPVPLFVSAQELLSAIERGAGVELYESLPMCQSFTAKGLHELLQTESSTLFVDGLDEISEDDRRNLVFDFMTEAQEIYPRLRVVAAMRISYLSQPKDLKGFEQGFLAPMNSRAMYELVTKILGQAEKSVEVLRSFHETGLSDRLPRTPLVVTLIAILHELDEMGEVPANIADLYDMFIQVYLGRWNDPADGKMSLDLYNARTAVLREVAVRMHVERRVAISMVRAIGIAEEYLAVRGRGGQGQAMVEWIVNNSGVLSACDGEDGPVVSFSHLSFQEFFTATHLDDNRAEAANAAEWFWDPWWANVLTFYAGIRKDVPEIVRAIRDAGAPEVGIHALGASLQLGYLLQAATLTPTPIKLEGCLFGSDLMQYFYSDYAERQKKGKVPIRMTRFQMLFCAGVWFSTSYGSGYLADVNRDALDGLLVDFEEAEGDDRLLIGVRVLAHGGALARRGDWGGINAFIAIAKRQDFALLQSAAALLEFQAPGEITEDENSTSAGSRKSWEQAVRAVRKFAPKDGSDAIKRLAVKLSPVEGGPRMLDRNGDRLDSGDENS